MNPKYPIGTLVPHFKGTKEVVRVDWESGEPKYFFSGDKIVSYPEEYLDGCFLKYDRTRPKADLTKFLGESILGALNSEQSEFWVLKTWTMSAYVRRDKAGDLLVSGLAVTDKEPGKLILFRKPEKKPSFEFDSSAPWVLRLVAVISILVLTLLVL